MKKILNNNPPDLHRKPRLALRDADVGERVDRAF
jgi:hypothetical protein